MKTTKKRNVFEKCKWRYFDTNTKTNLYNCQSVNMNQNLPVTITFVPPPNTTVIQFVFMAVQKPPDLLKAVEPPSM